MVKPLVDVFKTFNNLVWRDQQLPCIALSYGFSQEHAEQKFIFRDTPLIQSVGRSSQTFRYTIPFRQNIAIKFTDLWTDAFPQFLEACLDRSADTLIDPIHGSIKAKVTQFSYDIQAAQSRDGVDVQVEFVESPDDTAQDAAPRITLDAAKGDAGAFDRQIATVDWAQTVPPEPTVDIFNVVSGLSDQVSANINKIGATLDRIAYQVDKTQDSLEKLGNVKNWSAIQAGKRLKQSCNNSKKLLGAKGKILRTYITPQQITLPVLAVRLQTTTQDLLNLNPSLARSPSVRANTAITYLADNSDGGFIKV